MVICVVVVCAIFLTRFFFSKNGNSALFRIQGLILKFGGLSIYCKIASFWSCKNMCFEHLVIFVAKVRRNAEWIMTLQRAVVLAEREYLDSLGDGESHGSNFSPGGGL